MRSAFSVFAAACTRICGSPQAFTSALSLVAVWALWAAPHRWDADSQMPLNTGTGVITFLMVFLIQHAQNKDNLALHTKLDAIIHAIERADDALMGLEEGAEEEIERARKGLKSDG